eukprot:GHVU01103228.1.p1 GENE.GHVU01103228.1~~GHVU01103228.1.p1  ORF type:complete len:413 (-),score=62.43 GHVU01103228.1:643-1755(-)
MAANSRFSLPLKLHSAIRNQPGNLFYSPLSIEISLRMLAEGANGETKNQISRLLPPWRSDAVKKLSSDSARISLANGIFVDETFAPKPLFMDRLMKEYGVDAASVNFKTQSSSAIQEINKWVKEKTNGKITDLATDAVDEASRLFLASAISVEFKWADQFEPMKEPQPFAFLDGSTSKIPFMERTGRYELYFDKDVLAVKIPYKNEEASLVLAMPGEGQEFETFEKAMDEAQLEQIMASMTRHPNVALSLPKITMNIGVDLKSHLHALGVRQCFNMNADLTNISDANDLYVSSIVHKAYVKIDEYGTEAAAATGVTISLKSMPTEATFDRPFAMFMVHNSGEVLFMGRFVAPVGESNPTCARQDGGLCVA